MKYRFYAILLYVFVGLGCTITQDPVKVIAIAETTEAPDWRIPSLVVSDVASTNDIFRLSAAQQKDFLDYYNDPKNADEGGHRRLYNYLEEILSGFDYKGATYTSGEALQNLSGNCLSLAILTTALAKLVDIEVRYQRVNAAPIYQRFHNVMTLSSHVRTHVYEPYFEVKEHELVVIKSKLVIDYFPQNGNIGGDIIGYEDFVSMYYQNLAGDALVKEDYDLAYSMLVAAMGITSQNPDTLNTLAVIHKALGNTATAEALYRYVLMHDSASINVLSNYIVLLEGQNRTTEIEQLQTQLDRIKDDNPYRWFDVADRQYAQQNYSVALKYFKRSVEVGPYLHEGYFGLAKTYYKIGLVNQAKLNMARASELAFTPEDEYLYQAKLQILDNAN